MIADIVTLVPLSPVTGPLELEDGERGVRGFSRGPRLRLDGIGEMALQIERVEFP